MKRVILIFTVGVTMFGVSAGVSWYLRRAEDAHAAAQAQTDAKEHGRDRSGGPGEPIIKGTPAFSAKSNTAFDGPAPSLVRSSQPTAESIAQLAAGMKQQQESMKTREQGLQARQRHLELIHQDLRNERKSMDELRLQINEEMKALTEKCDGLDRKAIDIDKKKQEMGKQAQDVKQTIFEVENVEQKNFKKIAATFDAMEAETAGELLQQMSDSGKMDMAVKILSAMQERQAARVLSQMPDRATAVQLLDKMKGLKRPS